MRRLGLRLPSPEAMLLAPLTWAGGLPEGPTRCCWRHASPSTAYLRRIFFRPDVAEPQSEGLRVKGDQPGNPGSEYIYISLWAVENIAQDPDGSEVAMVGKKNYTGIITFPDFKIPPNSKCSHNKNVTNAKVTIFFWIKNDLSDSGKEMMLGATQNAKLIDGVAQISFNTSKAIKELSYKNLEDLNDKYLYIAVEVKGSTGGYFQETKVIHVKYVLSPYTLDLVATPLFLKPGIPYSIKVQLKDAFAHVVGGIAVTLKAKTVDKTQRKRDLDLRKSTTNYKDGVASFVIDIPSDVTMLEFHVRTDDSDLPEEYQASNGYQAVAYSSHSQSFLSLSWTDSYKSLHVGERLSITVTPKSPYVDRIIQYNYLISSKGKIVHFGTAKKLPGSSYQVLNLSMTQHMVPTARLLVYYIVTDEQTTELVSDSVCLKIEKKCGNQLQISLSPNKDMYSPGEAVSLTMETQSESWVALSSVGSALSGIQERSQNFMERILPSSDNSEQDCGAGGGMNNAEVFYLAGLTLLTNANADDSQQDDGSFKKILRSRRYLEEKIENLASTFRHPIVRQCCYDGAHENVESCEKRAVKVMVGPNCSKAFLQCCNLAAQLRNETSHTPAILARLTGIWKSSYSMCSAVKGFQAEFVCVLLRCCGCRYTKTILWS
ncbi:hypothetical protein MC885_014947 [Smutsia gigantea]|nr:hypothetical protein MC885_014947 [Smutsia gigantea]